jgi:hypothetical protein
MAAASLALSFTIVLTKSSPALYEDRTWKIKSKALVGKFKKVDRVSWKQLEELQLS